jgi:signal transduction histidine kinase
MLAWVWLLRREMAAQSALLAREMGTRRNAAVEFQATLRERNRLAANLHDTLLQTLRGIDFQLGACRASGDTPARDPWEHLAVAQKMVNHAAEELRGSVWALRTMPVAGTSFADSLATIARQTGHGHAEHIDVQVKGEPFELPQFLAGNLLLVAQEAIHNALAHADAGQIEVLTRFDPLSGSVELSVADDGRGFAEGTQAGPDQGHFGLTGMRERIERLGGRFSVETVTGSGTRVRAKVKKLDYDAQIDVSEQDSSRPEAGVSSTKTSKLKGH